MSQYPFQPPTIALQLITHLNPHYPTLTYQTRSKRVCVGSMVFVGVVQLPTNLFTSDIEFDKLFFTKKVYQTLYQFH